MTTIDCDVYVPIWDGLVSEWTQAMIRKNAWRVAAEFDPEDLLQEAFLVFAKCEGRYRAAFLEGNRTVYEGKNRRHRPTRANFFTMYKFSVINRFADLTRRHQLRGKLLAPPVGDAEDGTIEMATANDTMSAVLIDEIIGSAPVALQGLLRAELEIELPPSKTIRGVRETRNQRLARLAGVPLEALDDMQKKIEKWARKNLAPSSSAVCQS